MTDPRCNFYIGQKVIFKPIAPKEEMMRAVCLGINVPTDGEAYHVRGFLWDSIRRRTGLHLVEVVNEVRQWADGISEPGFWHCNFRPATDISELEKLLNVEPNHNHKKRLERV